MRPVLAFGGDAAVLWVPRVATGKLELVEAARIPLGGDPAAVAAGRPRRDRGAWRARPTAAAARRPGCVVALPPSQVLRKTLVLPAAVEENLRQALAYDLDRHTPFQAEELYFDAVVVGRDAAEQGRSASTGRRRCARHVDQARAPGAGWGATVVAVTPEMPGDDAAALPRCRGSTCCPTEARTDAAPWRRWQFWLPLRCSSLVAVAAAVALPIWQKRDVRDRA